MLTEAGSKKRASMYFVRGESALAAHDPGGLEVLEADLESFMARLTAENHTLKRALTDPHFFSASATLIQMRYCTRPGCRR